MTTFTWIPDAPAAVTSKTTVNKTKFGDGYEQRAAEGINSVADVWDLTFTVRTKAEIVAIRDFLKANKGVSNFTWTTPAGDVSKFICNEWKVSFINDQDATLSATFEQVFDIS